MELELKGIKQLFNTLDRLQAISVLEEPMQRAVLRLENRMKIYPPQRTGSTYIRGYGFPGRPTSERLGQSWTTVVRRIHDGVEGEVGNNTSYGPRVQSKRLQANVHKGRWQTDEDVMAQEERAIVQDFEKSIQDAIG